MRRLFIGLPIPKALRDRIHLMQGGIEGARWTAHENYHITLTFLGDIDDATAEDIDEALSSIHAPKFSLSLKGTGSFSQGEWPDVLWLGVVPNDDLSRLKDKIDRQLEMKRVPFEKRKYNPHVTMAYLKDADAQKLAAFMQNHNLFASDSFEVDEFFLYESKKTKNGTVYVPLKRYALEELKPPGTSPKSPSRS